MLIRYSLSYLFYYLSILLRTIITAINGTIMITIAITAGILEEDINGGEGPVTDRVGTIWAAEISGTSIVGATSARAIVSPPTGTRRRRGWCRW